MSSRRQLGLVSGAATLLASAPIMLIYDSLTWLFQAIITVVLVVGAAAGVRYLRGRLLTQVAAMLGALLIAMTLLHSSGTALAGLIPTPGTFAQFSSLMSQAGKEVTESYVPAPDLKGLLFVTTLGIGLIAIIVDVLAVGLRRPALAGLPMLAIYSVPVAVYVESITPIPFIIGAIGYLWLLVSDNVDRVRRFGRRFTGEGRGVDVWEPSPLAAAGRRLAIAGLLIAVVIPIASPAMTGWFDVLAGSGGSGGRGPGGRGPSSVDLFAELSGQLNQTTQTDLVRVLSNTDQTPGYMRFGVADEIVGDKGFRNRTPSGRPVSDNLPAADGLGQGARHRARIEITKNFDMPMVPIFPIAQSVKGLDANWKYDKDLQIVFSDRQQSTGRTYEVEYTRMDYTPEQLRSSPAIRQDQQAYRFTQVPKDATVTKLVGDLTKGKTTPYDKVLAIYEFFSEKNGFDYQISTRRGTTGKEITDFLDPSGRVGFCEQYATAMAWMVREAGIPSRVAIGFTRGTRSGDVYTLKNGNLHAWTEVYFQGYGWVPFDATPSAMVTGSMGSTAWAPDPNAVNETPGPQPSLSPGPISTISPSLGPDNECIDERGRAVEKCDPDSPSGAAYDPPLPMWTWWALAGGTLLVVLLVAPAFTRAAVRRRRTSQAGGAAVSVSDVGDGPQLTVVPDTSAFVQRAHAAWDELLDTMIDYRLELDSAETPRMTASRLATEARLPIDAAEQAQLLGHAEERARYAPTPLLTEGLDDAVKGVRKTLALQASRRVRLLAVLLPPSVTQRWRAAMQARVARFSALGEQIRYSIRRAMPRLRRS